ncbi:MAG: sigma 54-interacting transcriptional regulator, partial [Myxococcaceae bacterium]|nr:sigma 54-interacting transcriptional regulator [Myxococcaceae bacterium]
MTPEALGELAPAAHAALASAANQLAERAPEIAQRLIALGTTGDVFEGRIHPAQGIRAVAVTKVFYDFGQRDEAIRFSRASCCSRSCSATSPAPSPARTRFGSIVSNRRTATPCCSTRSPSSAGAVRRLCCARCRRAHSSGSAAPSVRHADVRVVAATNGRIDPSRAASDFRHDLYFRLAAAQRQVPPLRACGDDVVELAEQFLAESAAARNGTPRRLGEDAKALLRQHRWPGNVRELKNVIRTVDLMEEGDVLHAPALAPLLGGSVLGASATEIDYAAELRASGITLRNTWTSSNAPASAQFRNATRATSPALQPSCASRVPA